MTHILQIERYLSASPQDCFQLWVDTEKIPLWWKPKDEQGRSFSTRVLEYGAYSGGPWCICLTAPNGKTYMQTGEMRSVRPPHLLRFSFSWVVGSKPQTYTEVTVHMRPEGAGTRLVFAHEGLADAEAVESHRQGWSECLDNLVELLQSGQHIAQNSPQPA